MTLILRSALRSHPLTACLFQDASLCGRCVAFNLSKHCFKREALPFACSDDAARFSSSPVFADGEAESLSADYRTRRCQRLYDEKLDFDKNKKSLKSTTAPKHKRWTLLQISCL